MNSKYFKYIFIIIITIFIILGVYIIYIKDKNIKIEEQPNKKEKQITKDIIIGITEFDTINPILTKSLEMQYITKLIYEPLIDITQDFNIEFELATECSKINENTYIVKLDKQRIKAEDIEFTIELIKQSDSIYKQNVEKIDKIETIDETTLKLYLKEPVNFFEYLLCFPIVKKEEYNQEFPQGTTEYKVDKLSKEEIGLSGDNRKITIKIYKDITELYNNFSRENVDLILTKNINYEDYIGNIGFEETLITGREFYYLSCENIKEFEIRKLINSIINKEKIIYDLYNEKYIKAESPLGYGSYLNKEQTEEENSEDSLENLKLTLSIDGSEENKKIAECIKSQFKEKGIDIRIMNYMNKKADMILKKAIIPIKPEFSLYFEDEKTKKRIKEVESIENKEILEKKYEELIQEYYEQNPYISLFFDSYILLNNINIKGDFSGNWYNIFYNIDTWYKEI